MKLSIRTRANEATPTPYSPVRGMMQTGLVYTSRWSSDSLMLDRDMRQCPRRSLSCKLLLIDPLLEGADDLLAISGECLDISKNGLYAVVPNGYDIKTQKQYTFQLAIAECGPEPGLIQVVSQKGRVVRTELLTDSERHDRIGIGVQLVGPRTGVVTLPS